MTDPLVGDHAHDVIGRLGTLRECAPVHWWDARDCFLVLRYDDVARLVRSPAVEGSIGTIRRPDATGPRPSDHMMIRKDGDDHARLRRLVQRAFTPRAIVQWRAKAEEIVDRLLKELEDREEIDVVADYARRLPVQVISEMLGVPDDDIPHLQSLSESLIESLEPFLDPEVRAAVDARRDLLSAAVDDVIRAKRGRPDDDILTVLLSAADDGDQLTHDEVLQQVVLLYVAGHETTTNLVANGVAHLLEHRDQLDALRADADLAPNAVEEVLRYDPPALFTERVAKVDVDVSGTTVPAGARLALGISSANRDPRRWGETADAFDIARPDARDHIAFGGGPHHCLGAALARLEAAVAIPAIVDRFPRLALAEEPAWQPRVMARTLGSLAVTLP